MEDFETLEKEANDDRAKKATLSGGAFRLFWVYGGMKPERETATGWRDCFTHLRHWREEYPESVTPRIATAEAYIQWAWAARGNAYSDRTAGEGMRLFEERAAKALDMLNEASAMKAKDPHYYNVMVEVAIAQGWSPEKVLKVVKDAVSFDSTYYHTYQRYAQYLDTKWYGSPGARAAFATALADQVKGKEGDYLYFSVANTVDCNCEGAAEELRQFSWTRVKKGYAAGEEMYGRSYVKMNLFAHMAVTIGDRATATAVFKRMGGNFDPRVWGSEQRFRERKAWAYDIALSELPPEGERDNSPIDAGPVIMPKPQVQTPGSRP